MKLLGLSLLVAALALCLIACSENDDRQPPEHATESNAKTQPEQDTEKTGTLPDAENPPIPKEDTDPGDQPAEDPNKSEIIPTPSLP